MWIAKATRKEFLEIFELAEATSPLLVSRQVDLSEVFLEKDQVLIWKKDPKGQPGLPVGVLLPPGAVGDFLAWASTYLPSVRPFTAYCRVADRPDSFNELTDNVPLNGLENAYLGLILGEAVSAANRSNLRQQLPLIACIGTYSFAMARALALGIRDPENSISSKWIALRKLNKPSSSGIDIQALESIWTILFAVSSHGIDSFLPRYSSTSLRKISRDLVEAVWALNSNRKLEYRDWTLLTLEFPEMSNAFDDIQGTREDRVRSLDKYLVILTRTANRDPLTAGFIAGYLTSQVSPGTFDHVALLLPHSSALSSAIMWYGLCAGLHRDAELTRYSTGLGRRILRDLLREENVLDRPRCDIAMSELEIWMRGENNYLTDLKTNVPGLLEVEIAPCINTWLRWSTNGSIESPSIAQHSQQEIRSLVADLGQLLGRGENVRQRLSSLLEAPKPPEEMYTKKKKR